MFLFYFAYKASLLAGLFRRKLIKPFYSDLELITVEFLDFIDEMLFDLFCALLCMVWIRHQLYLHIVVGLFYESEL